jgi:hypothetical protein
MTDGCRRRLARELDTINDIDAVATGRAHGAKRRSRPDREAGGLREAKNPARASEHASGKRCDREAGLQLAWCLAMTITRSYRSLSLLIAMALLGTTAGAAPTEESTVRRTATATIANMLPVDGCSYPVTIDGVDYAPDESSLDDIRDLVPAGGTITAQIQYRLTGETGVVECGFGTSRELPEISLRVRRILDDGMDGSAPQPG